MRCRDPKRPGENIRTSAMTSRSNYRPPLGRKRYNWSLALYTMPHIWLAVHKPGTMMAEVQALVHQEEPNWDRPPTLAKLKAAQAQDRTRQQHAATIGHLESKLNVHSNGSLVTQCTTDSAARVVVPKVFQISLLYQAPHPSLVGHSVQCLMYDSMRPEHYWEHTSKDIYKTVDYCQQCAKRRSCNETSTPRGAVPAEWPHKYQSHRHAWASLENEKWWAVRHDNYKPLFRSYRVQFLFRRRHHRIFRQLLSTTRKCSMISLYTFLPTKHHSPFPSCSRGCASASGSSTLLQLHTIHRKTEIWTLR